MTGGQFLVMIGYNNGTWTDGTPMDYVEPINYAYDLTICAKLAGYAWAPQICDEAMNAFVCKYNP